jgi:hypothetical protein
LTLKLYGFKDYVIVAGRFSGRQNENIRGYNARKTG